MGLYADGLAAFDLSGEVNQSREIAAKCDLERWFSRDPHIQCRRSYLSSEWTPREEIILWMGVLDDVRWQGVDPDGLVEKALAAHPGSPLLHATVADWYLDRGEMDLAEWHLWIGKQQGRNLRLLLVTARMLAREGDLDSALSLLHPFRRKTPRMYAMYAEWTRLNGEPEAAWHLLDRNKWRYQDDPHLLHARYTAAKDAGEKGKSDEIFVRATDLFGAGVFQRACLRAW